MAVRESYAHVTTCREYKSIYRNCGRAILATTNSKKEVDMVRTLGTITLLTLAVVIPFREAAAQDPFSGAILGGATGAIIGGVAGGGRGAAIGAGVGAATGAIIGAEAQRRRGGYYWWRQGCYVERSDGAFVRVSSRYCG
jgi:hypothetical protein